MTFPVVSGRTLQFGKETIFGDTVGLSTKHRSFVDESLAANRGMLLPHSASFLEPRTQAVGPYKLGGTINQFCTPDEMGELLASLFGAPQTTQPAAGYYKHIFKPTTDVRHYTMAVNKDNMAHLFASVFATSWGLKIPADGVGMNSFDCLAHHDEIGVYAVPTFETNLDPFTFLHLVATFGVTTMNIRALDLKTGHAKAEDWRKCGSQFLQGQARKEWDTLLSCDLEADTGAELQRFYNGVLAPGLLLGASPADTVTETDVTLTLTGGIAVGASSYKLVIHLPKSVVDTHKRNVNVRNLIVQNVTIKPRYDPASSAGIQVDLYNTISSYA